MSSGHVGSRTQDPRKRRTQGGTIWFSLGGATSVPEVSLHRIPSLGNLNDLPTDHISNLYNPLTRPGKRDGQTGTREGPVKGRGRRRPGKGGGSRTESTGPGGTGEGRGRGTSRESERGRM